MRLGGVGASVSNQPRLSRSHPIRLEHPLSRAASAERKLPGSTSTASGVLRAMVRPARHGPSTPRGSMVVTELIESIPSSRAVCFGRVMAVMHASSGSRVRKCAMAGVAMTTSPIHVGMITETRVTSGQFTTGSPGQECGKQHPKLNRPPHRVGGHQRSFQSIPSGTPPLRPRRCRDPDRR